MGGTLQVQRSWAGLFVLPTRWKQKVLVGSAFSPLFDHDKQLPRSKRKKRRPRCRHVPVVVLGLLMDGWMMEVELIR